MTTTPDMILFQSFCFLFYFMNTYSIFSHAYYSKLITPDYLANIMYINFELIYIYILAYMMLRFSQVIYLLILNTFNYFINTEYNFESNRFTFMKFRSKKN
jgi:hypothetical protein